MPLMKIRTRLAIAFLTITVVPISLIYVTIIGLNSYQARAFRQTYGLSEEVELSVGSSIRVFSRLTESKKRLTGISMKKQINLRMKLILLI